ncbi:hypothetical protein V7S43_009735 [Phytophthora oleae]|uniref:Uncharacterized protein n=1 Tax=Phytophthora oleae TaxID=2107226 RepID=A0ABD3FDS5_9STRA
MMETKWRNERLELYGKLERSAEKGLDHDAVLAELFDFDEAGHAVPKEFAFQHEDDAVTVVCEAESDLMQASQMKDVYVSDQDIMHVTLFYTSHPDDLAPRRAKELKNERITREISLLRELATHFEPIRMVPVKVVLASSGAILMLFQCIQRDDKDNAQKVSNTGRRAEFGIDLLRQAAQETFPFVSKKSPNTIVYTTLARVMSPDAFDEAALTRVREACQRISQELAKAGDGNAFVVDKLWYVDESHFIRPTGHTTTISLGK